MNWGGEHWFLFLFPMWPHWLSHHCLIFTVTIFWIRLLKDGLLGLPKSTTSFIPWVSKPNNIKNFPFCSLLYCIQNRPNMEAAIPKGQSLNALIFITFMENMPWIQLIIWLWLNWVRPGKLHSTLSDGLFRQYLYREDTSLWVFPEENKRRISGLRRSDPCSSIWNSIIQPTKDLNGIKNKTKSRLSLWAKIFISSCSGKLVLQVIGSLACIET